MINPNPEARGSQPDLKGMINSSPSPVITEVDARKALTNEALRNPHVRRFYQDTAATSVLDVLPSDDIIGNQAPAIAAIEHLVPIAARDMHEHLGIKPEDEVKVGDQVAPGLVVDSNGKPLLTDANKRIMVNRIQLMRGSVKTEISEMIEKDPALAEIKIDPSTGIELSNDSLHRRTLMQFERYKKSKGEVISAVGRGETPFKNLEEAFEFVAFFGTWDMRNGMLEVLRNTDGTEEVKLSAVLDMMKSQIENSTTAQQTNNVEGKLQQISLGALAEVRTVKDALTWIDTNGDEKVRKMAGMLVATGDELSEQELLLTLRFFMAKSGKPD